jgi:hypothetical protein
MEAFLQYPDLDKLLTQAEDMPTIPQHAIAEDVVYGMQRNITVYIKIKAPPLQAVRWEDHLLCMCIDAILEKHRKGLVLDKRETDELAKLGRYREKLQAFTDAFLEEQLDNLGAKGILDIKPMRCLIFRNWSVTYFTFD